MKFPMHEAGLDTLDPCDHCNELFLLADMTVVRVFTGSMFEPPEDEVICDNCLGETDE